jgi:aryl-alcohol dehydrogenase-like predicted oxidoreductase
VALAWIYAQGDDMVPIPGTKRRTYLEENVGALSVSLSAAQLSELDAVGAPVGDRYPDMSPVNV